MKNAWRSVNLFSLITIAGILAFQELWIQCSGVQTPLEKVCELLVSVLCNKILGLSHPTWIITASISNLVHCLFVESALAACLCVWWPRYWFWWVLACFQIIPYPGFRSSNTSPYQKCAWALRCSYFQCFLESAQFERTSIIVCHTASCLNLESLVSLRCFVISRNGEGIFKQLLNGSLSVEPGWLTDVSLDFHECCKPTFILRCKLMWKHPVSVIDLVELHLRWGLHIPGKWLKRETFSAFIQKQKWLQYQVLSVSLRPVLSWKRNLGILAQILPRNLFLQCCKITNKVSTKILCSSRE